MNVLILEDDPERIQSFRRNMIPHDLDCVETPQGVKDCLSSDKEYDIVFLDHDLGGKVMCAPGKGTGTEAAEWMAENPDLIPERIVIHSFNPVGAERMNQILPQAIRAMCVWNYPLAKILEDVFHEAPWITPAIKEKMDKEAEELG